MSAVTDNDPLLSYPQSGPLKNDIAETCKTWAVKDLDCPASGCLGFQFTLGSAFKADATPEEPSPHRPKPTSYKDSTQFTRTATVPDDANPKDPKNYTPACFYPKLPASKPGDGQCLVP